jgi:hypothetical protein
MRRETGNITIFEYACYEGITPWRIWQARLQDEAAASGGGAG